MLRDVLDERVQGGDHLVVAHHLRLGDGGLAVAVVAEAEQVARAAPVAVAAGGDGVKHGLGDLCRCLCGQAVGQLDAGGVVGGFCSSASMRLKAAMKDSFQRSASLSW